MEYTPENMCGFLIRSRLMSPESARKAFETWSGASRASGDSAAHFCRWMVGQKLITEYQASLLVKGKVDDFFLNQYQIVERLGRGRMAGVYKAVHALGQTVAIKVLPPSLAKDAQMLARFHRESRLALKLKHPNVVRSFQTGEARGLHYLVMEYVEGETLDEVLQRRKQLPPQEAIRLVHQALMGLEHIHEMGMVHRDLKPANLILTPAPSHDGAGSTLNLTVKILDIGLGKELFRETLRSKPASPEEIARLTTEGTLLGTPDYLAPEQARDAASIDIRADIYSLGCVLYHCLAGKPPFADKSLINQLHRHATEMPRPLAEFNPQVADALQQIVNWMLAKSPEQRYPTPERAAQSLQMLLMAESMPAPPAEGSAPAPSRRQNEGKPVPVPLEDPRKAKSARRESRPEPVRAESTQPEPAQRDPATRDPATREPSKREPPKREPPKRESSKRERERESSKRESAKASPDRPAKSRPEARGAATDETVEYDVEPIDAPGADTAQPPQRLTQEEMQEIDVELVPYEPPQPTRRWWRPHFRLTSRDWILISIGCGFMVLLLVVVVVLVIVLSM